MQSPRPSQTYYLVLDILFLVFAILYMIGDTDHFNITPLRFAKPIPVWIMIAELWTVRDRQKNIKYLMVALAFGSLGDILLELAQFGFIFFAIGAGSFLVGHLIYVVSFLEITEDIADGHDNMRDILSLKALFLTVWIIFFTFSFWSIGVIMRDLDDGSIMLLIVPIYGTFLVLLVVGGLFFFFMTRNQSLALKAGICFMIGAIVFYASDSFLAHGKFDKAYQ